MDGSTPRCYAAIKDGVAALLSRMPVYTLDESDMKQMLIKNSLRKLKLKRSIGINWWNVLKGRIKRPFYNSMIARKP